MIMLKSIEEIESFKKDNEFAVLYFSTDTCNVCKSLFPKVAELVESFPRARLAKIMADEVTEAAGSYSVFTIPCILAYMDGKEIVREARYISIGDLEDKISRYYEFLD